MAIEMLLGRPIDAGNMRQLALDALRTIEVLGEAGDSQQHLLAGAFIDPASRGDTQQLMLQRTLRYLMRYSPFYQRHFASLPFPPRSLGPANLHQIPLTTKSDLAMRPHEFIATNARPYLFTRTTGTTGSQIAIWLSRYEVDLWPALLALALLLRNQFDPTGCLQVNLSTHATASIQMYLALCQLTGAQVQVLGLPPAERSLNALLAARQPAVTMMTTYPSYLAKMVVAARRRGLSPKDFRLRHIYIGSEVLSSSLIRATEQTFGVRVQEGYGATEILPAGGAVCSQGHLHPDIGSGFFEVRNLQTGEAALPGEVGTLVVTPYYPYRTCMPVFRYETGDVVKPLPVAPTPTCELAHLPATSHIEGKAAHLLWFEGQAVTERAIVEAVESLPSQPWPARFRACVGPQGLELELPICALEGLSTGEALAHLQRAGIPVQVIRGVPPEQARSLRRLRADLEEPSWEEMR
jgi:phenylacetate-coenzyme A ligase PaaK-like adenylate-forming protein